MIPRRRSQPDSARGSEFDLRLLARLVSLRGERHSHVMVNSNRGNRLTDYDTSRPPPTSKPLTLEDVLKFIEAERPEGVRPVRRPDTAQARPSPSALAGHRRRGWPPHQDCGALT